MSTLADTFIQDLEQLSSSEDELPGEESKHIEKGQEREENSAFKTPGSLDPTSKYECKLLTDANFTSLLEKLSERRREETQGHHSMIVECNRYLTEIEGEIPILHKYIRDLYFSRFEELEKLVIDPVEYAKTVKAIGGHQDITDVNLNSILPRNSIMSVTASNSLYSKRTITTQKLALVTEGCNALLRLDEYKGRMLAYLEGQMGSIAPNLSQIVGPAVAAKLIAAAGGVNELAKMPACNVQVLGAQRKELHGLSTRNSIHRGYLNECEMVKVTEVKYQTQLIRMLATKSTIAARIDAYKPQHSNQEEREGSAGRKIKEEIYIRFQKVTGPPVPPMPKPLPRPQDKPSKKRAGKRLTAFRKRAEQTEMSKMKNRIKFGTEAQVEYRGTGVGFGMLGVKGTGKLKVGAAKDQKIIKKKPKTLNQTNASGLTSSLVFTEVQGIKLINPDLIKGQIDRENDKYFSAKSGFTTVSAMQKSQVGNLIAKPTE